MRHNRFWKFEEMETIIQIHNSESFAGYLIVRGQEEE